MDAASLERSTKTPLVQVAFAPDGLERTREEHSPRMPASSPPRNLRRRLTFTILALALLAGGAWAAESWWFLWRFEVTSDDAYVQTDITYLATKIPGYVASVPVRENQFVAAGDVVVQLDDTEYRIALAAIEARLATQEARIHQITELTPVLDASLLRTDAQREKATIDLRQAEATLVRANTLAINGDASKVTLSEAIASRDRAKVGLAIAEADVTAAHAERESDQFKHHEAELVRDELLVERDRVQKELEHTRIRAPLSGRIGKRRAEPGDYVAVGERLAAIVPDDGFFIEANVKESQLERLCVGQPAQIALDAFPSSPLVGHIESFAPATGAIFSVLPPENATGNFNKIAQRVTVRLALEPGEPAQQYLRAGLSAVIHIDTRQATSGWRACAAPAQVIASP